MAAGTGLVFISIFIAVVILMTASGKDAKLENEEELARKYIDKLDKESAKLKNDMALAEWAYESNITKENEEIKLNMSLAISRHEKSAWLETITYKWQDFQDFDLKRKFFKYSKLGSSALPDKQFEKLAKTTASMQSNYATSKICSYTQKDKCDLSLEPDIVQIFADSKDPKELEHTWVQWHNQAGRRVKNQFIEYVKLSNEAARLNNFTDNAENWLSAYEQNDFEDEMAKIWEQLKPLYLQIHAYVRRRLNEKYGDSVVDKKGPIPAHLLGNVWAQSWSNIESFSRPFPDKATTDITASMIKQNYTALKIFKLADEFFQSLNMTAMPPKFWQNSIIEKPTDGRELVCHASAWDFFDREDFRIKQCTLVNSDHFETVHHEMGHIQYYLQYKDLPLVYREGANPGFHEAVGDVISLSATTPKHLRKIGLLEERSNDYQAEINHLFSKGIEKIVFLPFAYLLDIYRYSIFRGQTTPENYNCHFWRLREDLQGIEPPVERTENDFDAAAKYHVSADVEYARYYVSFIIQFQFHRALCEKAGQYIPNNDSKKLVDCDIYQSADAGNALSNMLKIGGSRPWQDAMEMITGQRKMDANGILEYFSSLEQWLKEENAKTGEYIGWTPSKIKYCTGEQKAEIKASKATKQ